MKPPVFVELCCGSAAVSLCLWGAEPPFPYQGSKARIARSLAYRAVGDGPLAAESARDLEASS